MGKIQHFGKEDIGGEILPILTTGLYQDAFDALREYVQNAIDAAASSIEIVIDPSTVAISDTGHGMNPREARRAIRLGISDKNPTENIGFRGIGIYSAFNLCNRLEIFTKSSRGGPASLITFNFEEIRRQLLGEAERRQRGLPPSLFLEQLLEHNVYVEPGLMERPGTRVVLSGILAENYRKMLDWDSVVAYLQDVVPLPFSPDFGYGATIAEKFRAEDYRVVPLTLQIAGRREEVFRPYTNDVFTSDEHHYPPKFFRIGRGPHSYGFAWVCINGRRVLKDPRMRGLLLKKFGFSVGKRNYLEPLFQRTVFSRRITGEIILRHPGLIPNAARNDFEGNLARQHFLEQIPGFLADVSSWADEIQRDEKAREVLEDVGRELARIAADFPMSRRDKDVVLQWNVELAGYERQLKNHSSVLSSTGPDSVNAEFVRVSGLLRECKQLVKNALSASSKARRSLERDVVRAVQAEVQASAASVGSQPKEEPSDLVGVLDAAGISVSSEAQRALSLFEKDYILVHIDAQKYTPLLAQFAEALEEEP